MKWSIKEPKDFILGDYSNYYNQFTTAKILEKYKIWFADEMRFGLMTNEKRSWNKVGERTRLPNQMEYANRYLYSAVSPVDGESVHIIGFSDANAEATSLFLDEINKQHSKTHNIIIWDNAPFHKSKTLHSKKNISILTLPSYGQELNPTERFFGEMRKSTANKIYKDINEIEKLLNDELLIWINDKDRTKKLILWDYMKEQLCIIDS
ncbi:MAG: IS630 family transposase [Campylobacterota bacterium]|nr:IS630 family transposase [Campylobacterota bacterium]